MSEYDSDKTCIDEEACMSYEETLEELSQLEALLPSSQKRTVNSSEALSETLPGTLPEALPDAQPDAQPDSLTDAQPEIQSETQPATQPATQLEAQCAKRAYKKRQQKRQKKRQNEGSSKHGVQNIATQALELQKDEVFAWKSVVNASILIELAGEKSDEDIPNDDFNEESDSVKIRFYPRAEWKWRRCDEEDIKMLDFDQLRYRYGVTHTDLQFGPLSAFA